MLKLSEQQIRDIAESLELSFIKIYINKKTGKILEVPDDIYGFSGDKSAFDEDLKELEENFDEYIEIEKMDSHESFDVMEDYALSIENEQIRERLLYALSREKPFKNFKYEIDYFGGDIRQNWFKFRLERNIQWVREQLENKL